MANRAKKYKPFTAMESRILIMSANKDWNAMRSWSTTPAFKDAQLALKLAGLINVDYTLTPKGESSVLAGCPGYPSRGA